MANTITDYVGARNTEAISAPVYGRSMLLRMGRQPSKDRDTPLSQFVRALIEKHVKQFAEEHGTESGSLIPIARRGGWRNTSTVAMVKSGTGVGPKTAPGFAAAFGFASVDALNQAASAAFLSHGAAASALVDEPPTKAMAQAMEMVIELGQGTREQLRTAMLQHAHPNLRNNSAEWWAKVLLADMDEARKVLESERREREASLREQRAVRGANRERAAKTVGAKATPATHPAPAKRRRRAS